jgi:hypothetical protein
MEGMPAWLVAGEVHARRFTESILCPLYDPAFLDDERPVTARLYVIGQFT